MLSPEERYLLIGIVALLLFGGMVRSCRHRVTESEVPPVKLPSVEAVEKSAE